MAAMIEMITMGLMLHQYHYDDDPDDFDDDPDHVHVEAHLLHHLHLCLRVQSWGDCQLFKRCRRWLFLLAEESL